MATERTAGFVATWATRVSMGFMSRGNTCLELLCISWSVGRRIRPKPVMSIWEMRTASRLHTLTTIMLRLGLPVSRLGSISTGRQTFLRSFALSRFPPGGAPAGGRTRPRTLTPRTRQGPREHFEAQDNSTSTSGILDNSPLLEESQRPPASNPEHGLMRLLQNDSLVVTRFVISLPIRSALIRLPLQTD